MSSPAGIDFNELAKRKQSKSTGGAETKKEVNPNIVSGDKNKTSKEEVNNEQSSTKQTNTSTEHASTINTELSNITESEHENDVSSLKNYKKMPLEETHKRRTYMVRNDLAEQINEMAKERGSGFKTRFINFAIEKLLQEMNQ